MQADREGEPRTAKGRRGLILLEDITQGVARTPREACLRGVQAIVRIGTQRKPQHAGIRGKWSLAWHQGFEYGRSGMRPSGDERAQGAGRESSFSLKPIPDLPSARADLAW